jgi:hypothetical protein
MFFNSVRATVPLPGTDKNKAQLVWNLFFKAFEDSMHEWYRAVWLCKKFGIDYDKPWSEV